MEAAIIKIGNSKGLRLSKALIKRYDIGDKVELIMEADHIILKPMAQPRANWGEAFAQMHAKGDDEMMIPDVFEDEHPEPW